jgi:hypothetical protein
MFKISCKVTLLMTLFVPIFFIVQHFKSNYYEKSVIKEANAQIGLSYPIDNIGRRYVSAGNNDIVLELGRNTLKLVYELNIDCSLCLEDLKKINRFYHKIKNACDVAFFIITEEKTLKYVEYQIDRALENYDVWLVRQEYKRDNINLYLTDYQDKIVMAGDINKYPFLLNEYIKKAILLGGTKDCSFDGLEMGL